MHLMECKGCGSRELVEENGSLVCAFCQARYAPEVVAAESAAVPAAIKTEFDVILQDPGKNKIAVIKKIQKLDGFGLKEAKDLAESCPQPVIKGVSRQAADAAKAQLEGAGATVSIV